MTISRRKMIQLSGSALLGLGSTFLISACDDDSPATPNSQASPQPGTTDDFGTGCTLSPEQTEGPYYVDVNLVRKDITEGRPGLPTTLRFLVVDASGCTPLPDLVVEVWHADANGVYSDIAQQGTSGQTFLRGSQSTNALGIAEFQTIYPGWYVGRATHIHFKVHLSGNRIVTSQLYFQDAVNDQAYQQPPYNARTDANQRITNANDSVRQSDPDPNDTLISKTTIQGGVAVTLLKVSIQQS